MKVTGGHYGNEVIGSGSSGEMWRTSAESFKVHNFGLILSAKLWGKPGNIA